MSLLLLTAKKKFSPYNWFKKGEEGAWYDPSDLTTLFQDSAGTTPVTLSPMEQPVGLMLDKSKGLVLGSELVVNGTNPTNTTGWSQAFGLSSLTASNNEFVAIATVSGQAAAYTISTTIGQIYKISLTVRCSVSGQNIDFLVGGNPVGGVLSSLTNTILSGYFTATATSTTISVRNTSTVGTYYFNNVSVKQIAGNHAFQATAGNRPLLSARVNLLTKTEDFSDAVWGRLNITLGPLTLSPIGTLTGRTILGSGTPSVTTNLIYQYITTSTINKTFTFSVYLKAGTTSTCTIFCNLAAGAERVYSVINLTTEWKQYNIVCPFSINSSDGILYAHICPGDAITGLNNGSIEIWGADLRPTNSGALLPPYQRVNTTTDYDTVGFPLYLKCNGSSSVMATNTIDYTTTNVTKLTIVIGVRSEAGGSRVLLESSNRVDANSGGYSFGQGLVTGFAGLGYLGNGPIYYGAETAPLTVPYINVSSLLLDEQTTSLATRGKLRINNVEQNFPNIFSSVSSAGSIANYQLNLFGRNGSAYVLNGYFYGAIIRGAQSDTNSVVQTENYMAKQTGITF
jgi:hypothetical protein